MLLYFLRVRIFLRLLNYTIEKTEEKNFGIFERFYFTHAFPTLYIFAKSLIFERTDDIFEPRECQITNREMRDDARLYTLKDT